MTTLHDGTPDWASLPTENDLPCDDGEPLETARHRHQMNLLIELVQRHWRDRDDFFVGGNMFVYFSFAQTKKNDFRGPDFFVVKNTDARERKSWVVWAEDGRTPDVVVEITSQSTAKNDRGAKKDIYEQVLKVTEYFIYDPFTFELEGYRLLGGSYRPIEPTSDGRLYSEQLALELGVVDTLFLEVDAPMLRFFTTSGDLVPTFAEAAARRISQETQRTAELARRAAELAQRADTEAQRADTEAQRADTEAQRADKEAARANQQARRAEQLAEKLRAYQARFGRLPDEPE
jgi:Uma2 family endonuclease